MHKYSTSTSEKKRVFGFLAGFSFLLTLISIILLTKVNFGNNLWKFLINIVGIPSFASFYGLLFFLFNNFLWKINIVRKLLFVKTPNLNGTWKGHVISNFESHDFERQIIAIINQTWSRISIIFETNISKSYSEFAGIKPENSNNSIITYTYFNEPKPHSLNSMHSHRGTARLSYKANDGTLKGDYYSGRDRRTIGRIFLKREL